MADETKKINVQDDQDKPQTHTAPFGADRQKSEKQESKQDDGKAELRA